MLNMREQFVDKAWAPACSTSASKLADKDGQGAGMLNVCEQLLNKGDAGMLGVCEQLADKDGAGMLSMCSQLADKGGAGMLNMREQLADKDDAGMLNMCEQLADEDELCGQVVLGSSRPWSAYLTRLPLQNTQPNWTATSTWRTTSGASTAARCDTRPVYCSAADTARLLRQGNQESWAVW